MKRRSAGLLLPLPVLMAAALLARTDAEAAPIDEFRISAIEQQIRDLQDALREQTRQLAELRSGRPVSASAPASQSPGISAGTLQWLSAGKWQQLKPGMSELQVIELLGTPNQLRSEDGRTRQLMYAMEIGRSGFLSGKVTTQDGKVTQIELPTLR